MKILAVYNIKGGVGKTATAVNLAFLSSEAGERTLLWDMDPQGAATFYLRVQPRITTTLKAFLRETGEAALSIRGTDFPSLDILPADFSYRNLDLVLRKSGKPVRALKRLLEPLADFYDVMFLDCAPGLTLTSESVLAACDALLVPTIPTTLSIRTLRQLAARVERLGEQRPTLLPFFCMVDRRRSLHRETMRRAVAEHAFLGAEIPYASQVEQMGRHRAPLHEFARHGEAARAYAALWSEIRERVLAKPVREDGGRPWWLREYGR